VYSAQLDCATAANLDNEFPAWPTLPP